MQSLLKRTILKPTEFKRFPIWLTIAIIGLVAAASIWLRTDGGRGLSPEALLKPDNFVVARVIGGQEPQDRVPVTIIEIDDATFSEWGQPVLTPKAKLFELIHAAARRRPLAIVVDVDVTAATDIIELSAVAGGLEAYAADPNRPPLVLTRRLWYHPPDRAAGRPASVSVPTYQIPSDQQLAGDPASTEEKFTSLPRTLASIERTLKSAPNMIWTSPLHLPDGDGVIRSWRSAEAVCNPPAGHEPLGFLAPPLIVAKLLSDRVRGNDATAIGRLKEAAGAFAYTYCRWAVGKNASADAPQAPDLELSDVHRPRRIPFTHWRGGDPDTLPGLGLDGAGRSVPAVVLRSARDVLAGEAYVGTDAKIDFCDRVRAASGEGRPAMDCGLAEDRLVLIGATHVDARDTHATPLGQMFGVDILTNSVMAARRVGAAGGSAWGSSHVIGLVLFAGFAATTLWLPGILTTIFVSVALALFITQSGRLGLDAATGYEAVAVALSCFALYLVLGGLASLVRKWLRARRIGRRLVNREPRPTTPRRSRRRPKAATIASGVLLIGAFAISPRDSVAQTQPAIVGVVERIEARKGGTGRALLHRAGSAERPLVLGEYVHAGDRIRVPDADAMVVVSRRVGPLRICARGAHAEECAAIVDGEGTFLQSAGQMLRSLERIVSHYGTASAVSLSTRSASVPRLRIGAGRPQKILVGERRIWLAWHGGDEPFEVWARQPGGAAVRATGDGSTVMLPAMALRPGPLTISVRDGASRAVEMVVEVVATMPTPPDFSQAAPTELARTYLQAGWLALQGDGAFLLEAAMRLGAIADQYPAAEALRLGLAFGERPRP